MKSHHLFAGLILASIVVVFISLRDQSPEVVNEKLKSVTPSTQPSVSDSQIEAAMTNAAKAKYAVVFFQYDWSMTSVLAEREYLKFVHRYGINHSTSPVLFHHINLTHVDDWASIERIPDWKVIFEQLKHSRHFHQGDGVLIWLKDGFPLACENAFEIKNENLQARTKQLFGLE